MKEEWQPIETAPKDGRCILARTHDGDAFSGYFVVYWSMPREGWYYSIDRPLDSLTHWIPLPDPPKD